MPQRRPAAPASPESNGGEIGSFAKFRDRLLLWLVSSFGAVVVAGMGYFVHQSQLQTDQVRTDAREQASALRKEIGELRDRLNAELSSHAAFEAAQTTQTAEVIRRLNNADTKSDALASKIDALILGRSLEKR